MFGWNKKENDHKVMTNAKGAPPPAEEKSYRNFEREQENLRETERCIAGLCTASRHNLTDREHIDTVREPRRRDDGAYVPYYNHPAKKTQEEPIPVEAGGLFAKLFGGK